MKKYELKKEFLLEENYVLLAKAYNKIGDTQNSIKYYEKASETYKENDKRQGKVSADIIRKYDLATLKEELDISQKKSDQKSNLLTIATSSIGILLVSFIIFYKRRERQNKKKFEKLLANSESNHVEEKVPKVGAEKHAIPDAISSEILEKLKTFEAKEQYLKKNTTLAEVASKLKTNPKYLSKTVNKHKKKSFSNYIRDLRIQYVLHRLKHDKTFQSYTVQAIASEIGYKSSEAFSKAFKTETGLYPSYFIKQLQNTEKS
jgi:AraC-like DNA-binding protein